MLKEGVFKIHYDKIYFINIIRKNTTFFIKSANYLFLHISIIFKLIIYG